MSPPFNLPEDKTMTQHSSSRILILTSAFAVGGFVTWSAWANIDQITRAPAQVIASSRNQVIQAQDGGVVEDMLVKEGAHVSRGQPLVRFDKTKSEAAYLEMQAKAASLKAAVARLNAEVFGGPLKFPKELEDYPEIRANHMILYKKRQSAVNDEIGSMQRLLGLVSTELEINLPLLKSGDVSKTDVLKLQRQVAEIQGQITNRRNKYMQDSQTELAKAQEDLDGVLQVMAQRKDQLDHTVSTAPMDGIVRNVRITTRGGVARPGEEVMQIVPIDDDLLIEAKVNPADVAFIKPGLPASIKLDAYDYTIYGTLQGEVTFISADTLNDETRSATEKPYYRVQVKAKSKNFNGRAADRIEIQPGMTATVEIKTGSNSVLKYLTKPITKTISESLSER